MQSKPLPVAARLALLGISIAHVVGIRPLKQMVNVHARRIVAFVQSMRLWPSAMSKVKRHTVGNALLSLALECPVSAGEFAGRPEQALCAQNGVRFVGQPCPRKESLRISHRLPGIPSRIVDVKPTKRQISGVGT
jgi:hypothetical protein